MNDTILIKRYSNRKLYDTSRSKYITLTELGDLILNGKNIRVIDNNSKEDLTEITITQVLIAQQKQRQHGIRKLVQTQAEILLQRITVPVQQIRDEALRQVDNLKRKLPPELSKNIPDLASPEPSPTEDVHQDAEHRRDSLKSSSDEALLSVLLLHRVETLEAQVAELQQRLSVLESNSSSGSKQ